MRRVLVPIVALLLVVACDSAAGGGEDTTTGPGPDVQATEPDVQTTGPGPDVQTPPDSQALWIAHGAVALFDQIPTASFEAARGRSIFYGHTSHGSQLLSGLGLLYAESNDYKQPTIVETSGDLGHNGDLAWADTTRDELAQRSYDIVVWSWCGGVSDNTESGIDAYLGEMNQLEAEYPATTFVYMTGHTDGSGEDGTLRRMNARIRDYCLANDKVLFDFADIESWDPDGNYYPDISDDCAWCTTWCAAHTCPACDYCAHSHCFNCYQKGKAFWVLLARLAGWTP